jgi:MFS family permease
MTVDNPTLPNLAVIPASRRARLPRYALALLLVIFILNNVDRQIINILAEPIRKELHLHDWQIGMMTGFSFAIFYATLGIPIARLAEKGNRSLIIAISVAVWSAFTALCGITRTFPQLVLARVGVGAGEAGCTPAAVSLISDLAPREKRASALGIYTMGTPIGALLGMAIGGLVADIGGWRMAFLVAAAPGLLVAALSALTLKDPRMSLPPTAQAVESAPNFSEASRELRTSKTCAVRAGWDAAGHGRIRQRRFSGILLLSQPWPGARPRRGEPGAAGGGVSGTGPRTDLGARRNARQLHRRKDRGPSRRDGS